MGSQKKTIKFRGLHEGWKKGKKESLQQLVYTIHFIEVKANIELALLSANEQIIKNLKIIRTPLFFRIKLIEPEYPSIQMIFECYLLNTVYMKNVSLLENSKSI